MPRHRTGPAHRNPDAMSQRTQQTPKVLAASRFRRARPVRQTAVGAIAIIGTAVSLAIFGWMTFQATTLQTADVELRSLTESAEQKARADQGRRLLEQVAQQRNQPSAAPQTALIVPLPSPAIARTAEKEQPAAWGVLASLREKLRVNAPSANDLSKGRASGTSGPLPLRIPLTTPPQESSPAAWARFLISEHDLSVIEPARPTTVTTLPVGPLRTATPPSQPEKLTALPTIKPNQTVAPAPDTRRRHATTADCTSIIEQAQLGDLSPENRLFLQERCR